MEDTNQFCGTFDSPQEIHRRHIKILGNYIHTLRTNLQISITQCAEALGIDTQMIDKIERGNLEKIQTNFVINFIKFITNHTHPKIERNSKHTENYLSAEVLYELADNLFTFRKEYDYSLADVAKLTDMNIEDVDDIECYRQLNNSQKIHKLTNFIIKIMAPELYKKKIEWEQNENTKDHPFLPCDKYILKYLK